MNRPGPEHRLPSTPALTVPPPAEVPAVPEDAHRVLLGHPHTVLVERHRDPRPVIRPVGGQAGTAGRVGSRRAGRLTSSPSARLGQPAAASPDAFSDAPGENGWAALRPTALSTRPLPAQIPRDQPRLDLVVSPPGVARVLLHGCLGSGAGASGQWRSRASRGLSNRRGDRSSRSPDARASLGLFPSSVITVSRRSGKSKPASVSFRKEV